MNLKLKLARKLKVFSVLVARQHGRLIEIASLRDVLYVVVHIFMDKKDFNKVLGLVIMLIGICLAPFTYCLSLPVLSFFDWLLYQRVPNMVVCYDCRSEFRGFEVPADMEEFKHFLAEKFEKENK